MSQTGKASRSSSLQLKTDAFTHFPPSDDGTQSAQKNNSMSQPSSLRKAAATAAAHATQRATPPITIPRSGEENEDGPSSNGTADGSSFMEQYMRERKTSISFSDEVQLDTGQRQKVGEPLAKAIGIDPRGRSMLHALNEQKSYHHRAHSESERTHYDPQTGRHLPQYSDTPPREHPHVGEGRFPLLQSTVDEMARESHENLTTTLSRRSQNEPHQEDYEEALLSPTEIQPHGGLAFSYEESKPTRQATSKWRERGSNASSQDLFARAGSLRDRTKTRNKPSRRDTQGSTMSPTSAASSYLRSFSMNHMSSIDSEESSQPACDAEGQTIGDDYVIGKQIGFGGFSVIKEVTQLRSGKQRTLAVKIVRRQIEGVSDRENQQAQDEFDHEVDIWRFLDHPHILPLEAVYKLEDATFCFIPLNSGGTLFDIVRANRNGVDPALAKSYSFQLAAALRYLHLDARVVHRDIKLENCLLEARPGDSKQPALLRVCDFGMADYLSSDNDTYSNHSNSSRPSSPEMIIHDRGARRSIGPAGSSTSAFTGGSLEYAAPEILRIAEARARHDSNSSNSTSSAHHKTPERSIVSTAVDVWAYGVCVYSLLIGSRPFQNAFQPRVLMAILAGDWDKDLLRKQEQTIINLQGGEVGRGVSELVQMCLAMDDTERWSISQVLDCEWFADMDSDGEASGLQDGGRPNTWRL